MFTHYRQYFENTAVETAFIGYSSEAVSLGVRMSTDDTTALVRVKQAEDSKETDQIWEEVSVSHR